MTKIFFYSILTYTAFELLKEKGWFSYFFGFYELGMYILNIPDFCLFNAIDKISP